MIELSRSDASLRNQGVGVAVPTQGKRQGVRLAQDEELELQTSSWSQDPGRAMFAVKECTR